LVEGSQQPPGCGTLGGPGRTGHGIDPAPGCSAGRLPVLERSDLDWHAGATRELCHVQIGVKSENRPSGQLELAGLSAGAAADIQDVEPGAAAAIRLTSSSGTCATSAISG
jgi:hypothetical protein